VVFRCSAGRTQRVPGPDLRYRWAVPVSRNLGLARLVACAGELHGVSAAAIPTCVLGETYWLSLTQLRHWLKNGDVQRTQDLDICSAGELYFLSSNPP
jgi:hypothetical protein